MIKARAHKGEKAAWRKELARAVRRPEELARLLRLDKADLPGMQSAEKDFKLLVPRGFVNRMRLGDPADPLLVQVLPQGAELAAQPVNYTSDALGEADATRSPGLLTKYRGRALLVTSGACAVHCRYCFRRHFPYSADNPRHDDWSEALAALGADPSIHEVILSGGDPLMLDDDTLADLSARLGRIPHLRRLRIHTRLPIVLPERVDEALLAWLANSRLPVTMVVHANHPNEMDCHVREACARLRPHLHFLLNQAVLLAGINADVGTLEALGNALDEAGILPYYLHLPDKVSGTAHFAVDEALGVELLSALRARLPGYLVPRLAREVPGAESKLVIA